MEKKKSMISILALCLVLAVLCGLAELWPWVGIPFGIGCIVFPRAAWIVTGGFSYLPVEPSTFALRSRQAFGIFLIAWTIGRMVF